MSFSEGYSRGLGFKAGSIRGIEVWVHWALVFFFGIELVNDLLVIAEHPVLTWTVSVTAFVVSLLAHELGHAFMARRLGGGADRIVLWPLGGLALCDIPHEPRSHFWVAAAGPLVDAVLGVLAAGVCIAVGWGLFPVIHLGEPFPFFRLLLQYLVLWNVFLGFLNLIPCYPLDGGRMLHAALWTRMESNAQALLITLRAGHVAAVFCLVAGLILLVSLWNDKGYEHPFQQALKWGLLIAALMHFVESKVIQHRLAHGEEDEGIFGYDFSRGYTSLERTAIRPARGRKSFLKTLRDRFRGRSIAVRREREKQMRERLDNLLQKVHQSGLDSLSRGERRFLVRASRLFKK